MELRSPESRRSSFHPLSACSKDCSTTNEPRPKSAAVTKTRNRPRTFWHYDVLHGLDYLRNAGIKPREHPRQRGHQNGRLPLNLRHPEYIPVELETGVGSPNRWNTLRALRVLRWYDESTRQLRLQVCWQSELLPVIK